jgi:hypothetical protein
LFVLTKYDSSDEFKKVETLGLYSSMRESRNAYRVLVGRPDGKIDLKDRDLGGRIILKRIIKGWEGRPCTGFMWLRIGKWWAL